jgi:hypothetical protein
MLATLDSGKPPETYLPFLTWSGSFLFSFYTIVEKIQTFKDYLERTWHEN